LCGSFLLSFGAKVVSNQSYPDLFVVGVQKCATTSLWTLLNKHPEICRGKTKEVHYFDWFYSKSKGPEFYAKSLYKDCKGKYVDMTPSYFSYSDIPIKMYQDFPPDTHANKRFVVILRDPVARMFSWYNHNVKLCVGGPLAEFLQSKRSKGEKMPEGGWNITSSDICQEKHCESLHCGKYSTLLRPGHELDVLATFDQFAFSPAANEATGRYTTSLGIWLMHFRRDQILIVNFEHLIKNTATVANNIASFFGLTQRFPDNVTLPDVNTATVKTVLSCATRDKLIAHYAVHVQDLYDYMERTPAADKPPMELPFGRFEHVAKCT